MPNPTTVATDDAPEHADARTTSTTDAPGSTPAEPLTPAERDEQAALRRLALPPTRRRARSGVRTWLARLLVLLMIAGAAYGGLRLTHARTFAVAQYSLPTVTLTAQAIPVESPQTGQITSVQVRAQQRVVAGQRLGTLLTTTTNGAGKIVQRTVDLTAPAAGIVSAEPATVGSTVQPGNPFTEIYDPAKLTLDARVPVKDLPQLSAGMIADLHADGLDRPIKAVVQRVDPLVVARNGSTVDGQDRLQLILVPQHPSDVADLVPGMRFSGTVNTSAGTGKGNILHLPS